ncbi:MAG TPA: nucleotidyltransferase family protein [Bryobacteraceae bacterium]|nr:nucleotidyltransferase family protein [Bryobacteraceae bacterium]
MTAAGLILAAGESRRMGYPKALLEWHGETFLDHLIGLLEAHCSPVVVVLGAGAEEIRARTRRPASFVWNADYRAGQTSSLQCGLRAVPEGAAGVLFTLVDHPNVQDGTVAELLRWGSRPAPLLRVPRYRGRRGHPVFFSRALFPEFLALPQQGAARDVVHAHAGETEYVDVTDAGILDDVDDPETYRRLKAEAEA